MLKEDPPTPPNDQIKCFILHSLATTRGVAADTSTPRDHLRMNISLQRTSFPPLSLEVGMELATHAKNCKKHQKAKFSAFTSTEQSFTNSRVSTSVRQKESCIPFQSSPSPTDRCLPRIIWAITSWMWFLVRSVKIGILQIPRLRRAETG